MVALQTKRWEKVQHGGYFHLTNRTALKSASQKIGVKKIGRGRMRVRTNILRFWRLSGLQHSDFLGITDGKIESRLCL